MRSRRPSWRGVFDLHIPTALTEARQVLDSAKINIDPVQIDLYQLGALPCRLLSGSSVESYLRSPRTKEKIPPQLRSIIDRALGYQESNRFSSAADFGAALSALETANDSSVWPAVPAASPGADTSPSVLAPSLEPDTSISHAARPSTPPPTDGLPFATLGHYEIVGRIGQGGMGDVYKGYEKALNRTVAIKVLPGDFGRQEDFVNRFYAEATAAAQLIHPNIVQIYYIGQDAGHHFFAMQYVEGESLAELLARRGRLGVDEMLAITEQTLSGLAEAHSHGLVHRDIKPGNILLDKKNRRALLADFGLVKALESAGNKTATGVIMGTADYIAPEQGRGLDVDARSDLYSIGVLMYQILSGRLPFEADSPTAMIFQHVYEQPPPLGEMATDIPAPLAAIVEKLMAKAPADRHQNADAVLDDLRAFRAGQPLPSDADRITPGPDQGLADLATQVGPERAGRSASDRQRSLIIEAPLFGDEPTLPIEVDEPAATGWRRRTRDWLLGKFHQHAPELVKDLQSTQQQMDGAVVEYERRRDQLAELLGEAESVAAELQQQARNCRIEAARAQQQAESATDDEIARTALRTKLNAERSAKQLEQQVADQQD